MLAALFLIATLPPDIGEPLRLYEPHAQMVLDEWEADPSLIGPGGPFEGVALAIMTYDYTVVTASTANMQQQCWRARKMGIACIPGMRMYPGDPITATEQWWWDNMRDVVHQVALVADAKDDLVHDSELGLVQQPGGDGRLMLDVEDYAQTIILDEAYLASVGLDVPTLRARMMATTNELAGATLCVYPVNHTDEAHAAIVEASGEDFEIWEERSFTAAQALLNGSGYTDIFLNLAQAATDYRARWPQAVIRHGLRDDRFRSWGDEMRTNIADLGHLSPWTFRYWRGDTNSAPIGSADWVSGVKFDSRNDAASVTRVVGGIDLAGDVCATWWCADVVNTGGNVHGSIAGTCVAGGHAVEVGPLGGLVFDDGEYLWPYCNTPADPILDAAANTITITITTPGTVTVGGIIGHYNQTSLRLAGDDLVLRYLDAGGYHDQVVTQVPRGVPVSYTLSWDVNVDVIRVAASTDPDVDTQPYQVDTTGLVANANPTHIYGARAHDGTQWVYCEGCEVSDQLTVHHRAFSCAEANEGGPSSVWPWGRF